MRSIGLWFWLWLGTVQAAVLPSTPSDWATVRATVDGVERHALVYRPAQTNPPLIVFFSGTGATLEFNTADEIGRAALLDFANRQGVALIFPMPRVMDRGDWDNHSAGTPYWETATAEGTAAPASTSGNPDLAWVNTLLNAAQSDWGVDSQRIYSMGFSNGAFFSYFTAQQLADRIAGFAATGGGLVLSGTTAGEPACTPPVIPSTPGAVRSCSAAGWTNGVCQTAGATPRPIAPGTRLPPAFLEANDDDTSVPYAHTCNLAARLPAGHDAVVRIVHAGGGHIVNGGFLDNAWNMLKTRRLGGSSPTTTDADRLFRWAEVTYAEWFAPPGQPSQTAGIYYFRFYPDTLSYLGIGDGQVLYLPASGSITNVGPLSGFLPQVTAAGY